MAPCEGFDIPSLKTTRAKTTTQRSPLWAFKGLAPHLSAPWKNSNIVLLLRQTQKKKKHLRSLSNTGPCSQSEINKTGRIRKGVHIASGDASIANFLYASAFHWFFSWFCALGFPAVYSWMTLIHSSNQDAGNIPFQEASILVSRWGGGRAFRTSASLALASDRSSDSLSTLMPKWAAVSSTE